MLTGYHFTAYSNWPSIREHGLRISRIDYDNIGRIAFEYAGTEFGSWVFCEPPTDDTEMLGQLAFTMSHHRTDSVAFIRCEYDEDISLRQRAHEVGDILDLGHNGTWGVCRSSGDDIQPYHNHKPFDIVLANIPPEQVELIAAYGIREIRDGD